MLLLPSNRVDNVDFFTSHLVEFGFRLTARPVVSAARAGC
jgi:hypothetical protein